MLRISLSLRPAPGNTKYITSISSSIHRFQSTTASASSLSQPNPGSSDSKGNAKNNPNRLYRNSKNESYSMKGEEGSSLTEWLNARKNNTSRGDDNYSNNTSRWNTGTTVKSVHSKNRSSNQHRRGWKNNTSNQNRNDNSSNKTPESALQGVDRLRTAFMQSLQVDRERRLKESSSHPRQEQQQQQRRRNNPAGEGENRLEELLNRAASNASQTTGSGVGGAWRQNYGGAKAFRDRRKAALRQQQQQQQQNPNSNQNPYHQKWRNNGNNYANNNEPYKNEEKYAQVGVPQGKVNLKKLQNDLLGNNQNNGTTARDSADSGNNDGKVIVLPNRSTTLTELSALLRVKVDQLVSTLVDLGEIRSSIDDSDGSEYRVDIDLAELMALELGFDPTRAKRRVGKLDRAEMRVLRTAIDKAGDDIGNDVMTEEEEYYQSLPPRPPVVCIMGHVDHGKTTLMDSLRRRAAEAEAAASGKKGTKKLKKGKKKKKGNVNDNDLGVSFMAGKEAGGITQVISAFQVSLASTDDNLAMEDGAEKHPISAVTFLDTPGHAAFKAMRQSGSNGADVIVLVIAADDGVSPQTREIIDMYKSISRAQPGSISLVIAMTKIDKPGIVVEKSIRRIENQLMELDIFTEGSGFVPDGEGEGGVQLVPVSGMTGEGLEDLIEGLVLQSEIMDLRADVDARAEGLVIDAKVENGLGVVADCIIRWGKLEKGDYVVSGINGGRVRILNDVNNKAIKKASPSQPVRIVGFKSLPKAGDPIVCVQSEEIAKEIISRREGLTSINNNEETHRADDSGASVKLQVTGVASKQMSMTKNILQKYGMDEEEESCSTVRIPVLIKADADGTLAALRDSLLGISDESKLDLCIDPVGVSIGHVTTSDVRMARESGACIVCFNLKGAKDKAAMSLAESEGVKILSHDVIYHLLDEAKDVFSTYCPKIPVENVHGSAVVQAVFDVNNAKNAEKIAGLKVQDGILFLNKSSKDKGDLPCKYRVKRAGKVISPEGLRAKSLRRVKEEVTDVRRGDECGLGLLDYLDLKEGDIIECFSVEMKNTFV